MSVWDLATIDRVSRFHAIMHVSLEVEGQPGATDAVRSHLTRWLQEEARSLAVEIHAADVSMHRGAEDDNRMTVEYAARWQPSTGRCQLLGGQMDGTMYDTTLRRDEPLRVPYKIGPTLLTSDEPPQEVVAVTPGVDLYEVVGWSEEGRYWIRAATR